MKNKRVLRKMFILLVVIFITAVTLIFETYAWFVGISSVSVGQFDVSISSGEGLKLSLNGSSWSDTITIDPTTIGNIYSGNKNKWSNALSPVSTDGLLDTTSSKLNLYAKSSLSASAGGYKIVSNKLINSSTEQDGYIVFDVFIKNTTGGNYDATYSAGAEEDIYLTADSNAYVPTAGSTNYGLANSIRVGFFEIGRTAIGSTTSTITGLTCGSSPSLCASSENLASQRTYTWNIWEPNAAKHSTGLVTYFNQICKNRNSGGTYESSSCFPLEAGSSRKTYGINTATTASDGVDIYDGLNLNTYTSSSKLTEMNTYKTSYATSSGNTKPPLIRVAGQSITKVRVYVWLEGQDIDNYDVATNDSQVNINFGFTKDRFGLNSNNVNNPSTGRKSSFEDDSWAEIQANVTAGTTTNYNVGDTKEILIDGVPHILRLANKSSNSTICTNSSYSQTACGFVIEFADLVEPKQMHETIPFTGGWPNTNLYTYLQGEFYNKLPSDLQEVIGTTKVISGTNHGASTDIITTNDKLYLLSPKETHNDNYNNSDRGANYTRQLDYYHNNGVTSSNKLKAYKYGSTINNGRWWLRSCYYVAGNSMSNFATIRSEPDSSLIVNGNLGNNTVNTTNYIYISPAFRIVP